MLRLQSIIEIEFLQFVILYAFIKYLKPVEIYRLLFVDVINFKVNLITTFQDIIVSTKHF